MGAGWHNIQQTDNRHSYRHCEYFNRPRGQFSVKLAYIHIQGQITCKYVVKSLVLCPVLQVFPNLVPLLLYCILVYGTYILYRCTVHVNCTLSHVLYRCTVQRYCACVLHICSVQVYWTYVLYRCTVQMYCTDVLYRCTVQVYCTGVLYRCTTGVPPPGSPAAAPDTDGPDWLPLHHTGSGH